MFLQNHVMYVSCDNISHVIYIFWLLQTVVLKKDETANSMWTINTFFIIK